MNENMYRVEIRIQCSDKFSKVLPFDLETVEIMIEDAVSRSLLELFAKVNVNEVTIGMAPQEEIIPGHRDDIGLAR